MAKKKKIPEREMAIKLLKMGEDESYAYEVVYHILKITGIDECDIAEFLNKHLYSKLWKKEK